MKEITTICSEKLSYSFPCNRKDLLFLDIETTGFSAHTSALYLIGVVYYENDNWYCKQWFADDYKSEASLLTAFFSFLQSYTHLIHFNGIGFDIPFLEKKCHQHKLTDDLYSFDHKKNIDLYKAIFPHRKRLAIPNTKQKTLENFLGISRDDTYTGGELIKFYQNYLKAKLSGDATDAKQLEAFLLLHNHDDLIGMLQFSNLLYLSDLLNGSLSFNNVAITKEDQVVLFHATCPYCFPCRYQWQCANAALSIQDNQLTLVLPIYQLTLKYFFDTPKDYYYLPTEDRAIHKSIASFVDKDYRKKATHETCYEHHTGNFLPVYTKELTPYFRESYQDKQYYILLDDDFYQDKDRTLLFLQSFLKNREDLLLEKIE